LPPECATPTIVGKIAHPDHLKITEPNLLRLNTFGRLFVEREGQRLSGAASQPRRLALLALVACSGDQGMTRDQLLGMLWPESDEERARKGLNQALYALRQEMGADEVFLGTRDLRLNPELVTSDLATFTSAIKAGQLERATAEYIGPFLDGFHLSEAPEFERWLEEERAGLARDYATALQRLARCAAERGERLVAAEWWRKLAAQDPLNARVAMGLMEALIAAGDRTAALQHARVYEVLVQQELEAPPDREVVALADRIRQQSGSLPAYAGPAAAPKRESTPEGPRVTAPAAPAAEEVPPTVVAPVSPPAESTPEPLRLPAEVLAPGPAVVERPTIPARPGRAARRAALGAALGLGIAAGGLAIAALLRRQAPPEIRIGHTSRITAQPGLEVHPALSPDGKLVAFAAGPAGQMRIYVHQLAGGRTIAVTEGLGGDQHWPRWSPDGSRLSFEMGRSIYVIPALGGTVKLLVAAPPPPLVNGEGALSEEGPSYLAWSPDGRRIAYAVGRGIYLRAVDGGVPTLIATLDQPHSFAWSPDGSRLAFVLGNAAFVYAPNAIGNIAPSSLWIISAAGGRPERVTDETSLNTSPAWMPDGRSLLFVSNRDGSRDIYRIGIGRSGTPTGPPVRLTTGLQPHTIDLSRDGGVIAYASFTDYANIWTLPIPHGDPLSAAGAQPVTVGHQSIEGMAISPNGRWLAFDSDRGGNQAIYRLLLSGGEPEPLSSDPGDDFMPSWSPDGREIAYYGFRRGRRHVFVMPVDGGTPSRVVPDSDNQRFPDWSPDGRHLVFHSDRTGRFELYVVDRNAGGDWAPPRQVTKEGGQDARWSPDGRAIVYVRNTGLWVIPPDGGEPRLLVDTSNPAVQPAPLLAQWAPDGRTIYYKALDAEGHTSIWSISPEGGLPRLLVHFDDPARSSSRAEFATDGKRFYFTVPERESDIWRIELVAE
jgi:Tol biopolymer transport system component/DNA-binding SARP family transcriptional activator